MKEYYLLPDERITFHYSQANVDHIQHFDWEYAFLNTDVDTQLSIFFNILLDIINIFFSIRVFFHGHWQLAGQQGKGGDLFSFHSTTSTYSRTFRHLCATLRVRCLSHIFNATLVFTRPLFDEIYHLIELLFDWLMIWCWFKFVCLLIWVKVLLQLYDMRKTGELELASTNTLVLQANRLTKYTSHMKLNVVTTVIWLGWPLKLKNSFLKKTSHVLVVKEGIIVFSTNSCFIVCSNI